MSGRTWLCADHHLHHANILNFSDEDGKLIRGSHFKDMEHHDNMLVEYHNDIVADSDRVYFLGDVCINKKGLPTLARFKGRKVLVRGNHDIFEAKDYLKYFDDIRAYVVQKSQDDRKVILSHIPLHPDSVGRWGINIHGHLHQHKINDPRYLCVSMEQIGYKPILLQEALKLVPKVEQ